MSAVLWPCECGEPGVQNLGTKGYCSTHLSELLRSFKPEAFELSGRWVEVGCYRPDHGPGYAECECPGCGATAVAVVGSPCAYCEHAKVRMLDWQAQKALTPPESRHSGALEAWAERLAVAVRAGIVTEDEARRAWRLEVRDVA